MVNLIPVPSPRKMSTRTQDNPLFKLDLLQCKFKNLNPPRFNKTLEICHSKRNNYKLLNCTPEEASDLIIKYQQEQFELKYREFSEKLTKVIHKLLKHEKRVSDKFKNTAAELLNEQELVDRNIDYQTSKILSKLFKSKVRNHSNMIPPFFYDKIKQHKEDNPHKTNSKEVETLFSKLYGKELFRESIERLRIQFKLILGPVRTDTDTEKSNDKVTKADVKEHIENPVKKPNNDDHEDTSISEEDKASEEEETTDSNDDGSDENDDDFMIIEDGEEDEDKDKKPSKKIVLPSLTSGYISGGEDEAELLKADEQIKGKTTHRRNRRGQRARRKIWEKKYGKFAKHIVKEREEWHAQRQRMELEYEARVEKRAEKQKKREQRMKEKMERQKEIEARRKEPLHPSWVAKRKLEESMSHVKFQGKKMKFD